MDELDIGPIFSARKLDFPPRLVKRGGKISCVALSTCNNVVIVGTSDCTILRYNNFETRAETNEIEISRRPEDVIDHIFTDPSGHHCIVTLKNGDNYYVHSNMGRAKKLSRLQGQIESIAFDPRGNEASTKSFLVGTQLGYIYELCIDSTGKEKVCQQVHQLEQPLPITSLYFEYLNQAGGTGVAESDVKIFVLCATSSPTNLYHFLGGPNFQQLFFDHSQKGVTSGQFLPGNIRRTELHLFGGNRSKTGGNANAKQTVSIMTDMGIYHGTLLVPGPNSESSGYEDVLVNTSFMPYIQSSSSKSRPVSTKAPGNSASTSPVSIAITEHHFLTLTHDRIQAMGRLNGEAVLDVPISQFVDVGGIPTMDSKSAAICLCRDTITNSIWLCTDTAVYRVIL